MSHTDVLHLANALSELCEMVPHLGSICNPGASGAAPPEGASPLPAAAIVAAAAAAAAAAMMRAGPSGGASAGGGAAPQQGGGAAGGGGAGAGGAAGGGSGSASQMQHRVPSTNSIGGRPPSERAPSKGRPSMDGSGSLAGTDPHQELQLQLQRQAAAVAQLQLQRQAAAAAQQQLQLQLQRQAQAQMWAQQQAAAGAAGQQQQQQPQQLVAPLHSGDTGDGGDATSEHRDLQMFMHQLMVGEATSPTKATAPMDGGDFMLSDPSAPGGGAGGAAAMSVPASGRASAAGALGSLGRSEPSLLASAAMDALPADVLMADDDLLSSLDYLLGDGAGI